MLNSNPIEKVNIYACFLNKIRQRVGMFVYIGDVSDHHDPWLSRSTTPLFWIHYSEFITHPNSQEENSHVKEYSFLAQSALAFPQTKKLLKAKHTYNKKGYTHKKAPA